jgi:parallel beta helix pectate lyase-like protein
LTGWGYRGLGALAIAAALVIGILVSAPNDGQDRPSTQAAQRAASPQLRACTRTLATGANLAGALSRAAPGAVLCLGGGRYRGARIPAGATDYASWVTIQPAPGQVPVFAGELAFDDARHLRLAGLTFEAGLRFSPAASHVQVIGNDISGVGGIFLFGDRREGGSVSSILIGENFIHDIDYSGSQGVYKGYGIKSIGAQERITVRGNTIKSVAADYLQTDEANRWTVDRNTFLGPSLVQGHPQEHQDLWQVYAGGRNVRFTNNIVRGTGTSQSLLFQLSYASSRFARVLVANNLFDRDSAGYSCQIYQSAGLRFRNNTIVGSRFGCLFRRDRRFPDGSGYQVDHNVFAETVEGDDIGVERGVPAWGAFDHNISSDRSATGLSSVRRWSPEWVSTADYRPVGLPFAAGYRP